MAKGDKSQQYNRDEFQKLVEAYLLENGMEDPMLVQPTILDNEGGETKWPRIQTPVKESKFKNLGVRRKQPMQEFKRFMRKTGPVTRGSGNGYKSPVGTGITAQPVQQPDAFLLALAGEDSAQAAYDYVNKLEALPRFQFDDTYAADSEGFRDYAGYMGDLAKVTLGAFGATKPLKSYTPSADFRTMVSESRQRRDMGLDATSKSVYNDAADRIYNYDVKNIRNMSGGSGGTALANLGGAADRYYQAQNQMALLDQQVKSQNRGEYYNAALANENVHRRIFEDDREIAMLNKQSGGMLMSDAMDNIAHRNEYENTYLKPGSPYYEYMKELTLDTRQNRALKEFGEQQRMSMLEKELANVENQEQDKLEAFNRQKFAINENWRNAVTENGKYPTIESAQDFKNYNGQPVVNINDNSEAALMNEAREKQDFGYSRIEMDRMTDKELADNGITRTQQEREVTLPTGEKKTVKYFNYGSSRAMDAPATERTESDIELSNQYDTIAKEYSAKKKELLDTWYVKDEKKYNQLLKELEAEESAKKEQAKLEYLKQ